MARNKYSKDYRLLEEFNEKGKVKTDYEYIGKPYGFEEDLSLVEPARKKALALILFTGAAVIAGMVPPSGMMKHLWIAFPYALSVLPVFMLGDLLIAVQTLKEPFERRHADKVNNRYPALSLAIMYLMAIAVIGSVIVLIREKSPSSGDIVFCFCAAAALLLSGRLFGMRKLFRARELPEMDS